MGKESDRKRSARRLGKHERARVKKKNRHQYAGHGVSGAGTVYVKAGRKKFWRTVKAVQLAGDSITPNALVSVKRPDYKAETSAS